LFILTKKTQVIAKNTLKMRYNLIKPNDKIKVKNSKSFLTVLNIDFKERLIKVQNRVCYIPFELIKEHKINTKN